MSIFNLGNLNDFHIVAESPRSRTLKREYIKKGYVHQVSFYGVITNNETHESRYNRIEILADQPYTQETLYVLHDFFGTAPPPFNYSIWIYTTKTDELKRIWSTPIISEINKVAKRRMNNP